MTGPREAGEVRDAGEAGQAHEGAGTNTRGPVLRVLPGVAGSAAAARAMARDLLGDASPAAETVMLLISELVTNAIVHTRSGAPGGTMTVALCPGPTGVLVQVRDDGAESVPQVTAWRRCLTVSGRPVVSREGDGLDGGDRCAGSPGGAQAAVTTDVRAEDEHGYGLVLVDALADSWGTIASPEGRVTWFRVSRDARR